MKLSDIADNAGSRKKRMRVGRGIGSGKGKTSGRGGKGQTARSGVRIKGFEGGQMPMTRRLPKRGFTNIFRVESQVVSLEDLSKVPEGTEITPDSLVEAGVIRSRKGPAKLLANGELAHAVTVRGLKVSAGAREKIVAAGGRIEE